MNKRITLVLIATSLLALPFGAQARGARPLVEPSPVLVPSGTSLDGVAKTIKLAMADRGWTVGKETPGYIEANLAVRVHRLRIGIQYDASRITIKYIDSAELKYGVDKQGRPVIHPKYMGWTQNLTAGISKHLLTAGTH